MAPVLVFVTPLAVGVLAEPEYMLAVAGLGSLYSERPSIMCQGPVEPSRQS